MVKVFNRTANIKLYNGPIAGLIFITLVKVKWKDMW